jgi:Spy/CpxP family protein refolding chaperone
MTRTSVHSFGRRARRVALSFLAVAACVLALGAPAHAQAAPGGQDYKTLGLSAEQKASVRGLHQSIGAQMRSLDKTLRARRRALEAVYGEYDLDTAKARQLNNQINNTQRAILDQHLRLQSELRKILTQDQFSRLQTIIRQHQNAKGRK